MLLTSRNQRNIPDRFKHLFLLRNSSVHDIPYGAIMENFPGRISSRQSGDIIQKSASSIPGLSVSD